MVFITVLSQLPLENTYINKNSLVTILGLLMYALIGGMIYTNRFPVNILSSIPDKRYLLLIIALDLTLFLCIYRFQYGELPSFSNPIVQGNKENILDKENNLNNNLNKGNTHSNKENKGNNNKGNNNKGNDLNRGNNRKNVTFNDDVSSWAADVNIDNDLESTFKRPGIHTQPELPEEASIPGGNYFNEDRNNPKVENWELDEYTNADEDDHMMID